MNRRTKILIAVALGVIFFAIAFVAVPKVSKRTVNPSDFVITERGIAGNQNSGMLVSNASARVALFLYDVNTNGPQLFFVIGPRESFVMAGSPTDAAPTPSALRFSVSEDLRGTERLLRRAKLWLIDRQTAIRGKPIPGQRRLIRYGKYFGHEATLFADVMNAGTNRAVELHR